MPCSPSSSSCSRSASPSSTPPRRTRWPPSPTTCAPPPDLLLPARPENAGGPAGGRRLGRGAASGHRFPRPRRGDRAAVRDPTRQAAPDGTAEWRPPGWCTTAPLPVRPGPTVDQAGPTLAAMRRALPLPPDDEPVVRRNAAVQMAGYYGADELGAE